VIPTDKADDQHPAPVTGFLRAVERVLTEMNLDDEPLDFPEILTIAREAAHLHYLSKTHDTAIRLLRQTAWALPGMNRDAGKMWRQIRFECGRQGYLAVVRGAIVAAEFAEAPRLQPTLPL